MNVKIAKFERDLTENLHRIEEENKMCESLKDKEAELTEKCNARKRAHVNKMAKLLAGRTGAKDELNFGDFKGNADELEIYRRKCMAEFDDRDGKQKLELLEDKVKEAKKAEK